MTSAMDSPVRHVRTLKSIVGALTRRQNYVGILRMLATCSTPVDFLKRYVTNSGSYPTVFALRTPTGVLRLTAYCSDDVQTINEIFFRNDYVSLLSNTIIVDFGSNIGISAAYFLTRNADAYVYCFEPLPQNIQRLRMNLAPFDSRFELKMIAVGTESGTVRFGWEPTGRYGGVGRETGKTINVECEDSNTLLESIISRHGRIDLLKIDIETLEKAVTSRITPPAAALIQEIVVEYPFFDNPLADSHDMRVSGCITRFTRKNEVEA